MPLIFLLTVAYKAMHRVEVNSIRLTYISHECALLPAATVLRYLSFVGVWPRTKSVDVSSLPSAVLSTITLVGNEAFRVLHGGWAACLD